MIETGFGKEFSEPPRVSVSDTRTNCEACKEPLDPSVMHKCHGNQEFQAPVASSTEVTETCPECETGEGVLLSLPFYGLVEHVVVCKACCAYLHPLSPDIANAIASWNTQAMTKRKGGWPRWMAGLPGDDERANVIQREAKPARHPDLSGYKGACPRCHGGRGLIINADTGEAPTCDLCGGTGEIK